jgi:YD repeat-containing protein
MPATHARRFSSQSLFFVAALAGLPTACGLFEKSDKDSQNSVGPVDVTAGVDARFAAIVAFIPKVTAAPPAFKLFDEEDFYPGLISKVTEAGDPKSKTTVTYTLNAKGFPTLISSVKGTDPAEKKLEATYAETEARPASTKRYRDNYENSKKVVSSETTMYGWGGAAPFFENQPNKDATTSSNGDVSATTTVCATETNCTATIVEKPKDGKEKKLKYSVNFVSPRILQAADATLIFEFGDFKVINTQSFANGVWTGTGSKAVGTSQIVEEVPAPASTTPTSPAPDDAVEPTPIPAPSVVTKTVPTESNETCSVASTGIKKCQGSGATDGKKTQENSRIIQLVLEQEGNLVGIEDYPLEETQTYFSEKKPGTIESKSVTQNKYDALWRVTSEKRTTTNFNYVYDSSGKVLSTNETKTVSETLTTYVGDTRNPASKIFTFDGKQQSKTTYVYKATE